MRRITFFKMMLVTIVLVIGSISATAQLLVEDFNYTTGTLLTANGWTGHSGVGTNAITVAAASVSYSGYASSGVGNEVTMTTSGEDDNKAFTSTNSGSLYAAFIVNVTSATTGGDYFTHFCQSSGSGAAGFFGRVFVKKDASNNLAFGISKQGTAVYSSFSYALNTTYLIVIKYTFNSTASDDVAYLFVNPAIGGTEPSPLLTSTDVSTDATGLIAIALRQGGSTTAPVLKLDGIRVATTWADAVAAPGLPKVAMPSFSAVAGNVITPQSVTLSSTTAGASIYYTVDGTDPNNTGNGTLFTGTPIAISSTTTIKAIGYYTGMLASTISSATYTFATNVANIGILRTLPTNGFYKLTGEAVLTYQSPSTYGKPKFIQDATGGIYVYDAAGKITTLYNVNDGITGIYGTLVLYNGYLLEFYPVADPGAASSTGNIVTPTVVTIANLANYPSRLVTVRNAAISGSGNFVVSTSYPINDGTVGTLRTYFTDLPYIGAAIPTSPNQDITGIVYNYSLTETDLIPRTAADMINTTVTAINHVTTNSNTYASKGNVVLTAAAGESVQIFNATGQRLVSKIATEGLNTIPVSAKGVVLVKVGDRLSKVIL